MSTSTLPEKPDVSPQARADQNISALLHFIHLARCGAQPGSSSGEKVAHQIAKALHQIGDDLCLLDADAIHGLQLLIRYASGPFPTAETKDAIYRQLALAAGKRTAR